jgi:hypothetical protein
MTPPHAAAPNGRRNRLIWSAHVAFHAVAWIALIVDLGLNLTWAAPLLLLVPLSAVAGLIGLAIPGLRAGVGRGLMGAAAAVSVLGLAPAAWVAVVGGR